MKAWMYPLFVSLMLLVSTAAYAVERTGTVTIGIDLGDNPQGVTRLWVPYPVSNEYQTISDMSVTGTQATSAVYGNAADGQLWLYAEWDRDAPKRVLELTFKAHAIERTAGKLKDSKEPVPAEVKRYLMAEKYLPTDGKVAETAKKITKGKHGILAKARAVYDWTVENTYRDPDVKGCGLGIVERTLEVRGGKCADISSVFVALARAAGVPARDAEGLRLGKKPEEDMTGGYHCWAEFYLPGTGWVPADPADVRKIMLIEKLDLKQAAKYMEYYFGNVDEYRIALEHGARGITLNPPQGSDAINYFMYPYAEIDGKALDYLSPKTFKYTVSFKAQ